MTGRRNRKLLVVGGLLGLITLLVLVLPLLLPDPDAPDPVNRLLSPSFEHPMGTDKYGRDLFARWASAGRVSIGMTLLITVCAATLGTFIGLVAGYFTRAGTVIMRVVDAWMAFPSIILAIVFAVVVGPGMLSELLAVTIIFTPYTARVIRSRVLGLTTRAYVKAARVAGMGPWKTLAVHVLPNTLPLAVVQCVLLSAGAMLIDGSLSFLGLGISPPTATWGNMVSDGRTYLHDHPTMVLFPGLTIALFVFLLNLAGSGLRTLVDPRARQLADRRA
ncbi:ABC transporter permease [Saccharothrix violaceirubra]|uniref:Peptide/nickel transport system permease protein n=1 Tax=Saccharothrix violaceirubra TaxID=413306 RepID=A0A7W7T4M5_9PSEU|nr:ABC transporter permease [Saccharothrix violaceirubra]MBB4966427.1 peptide/nickel transport system permease protein [Saccharothrix violaceirubra]